MFLKKRVPSNVHLIYCCSCSRDVLNSSDVVGKIVLCYQLAIASSSPPRRHFPLAASNVQEAGGKGIIFAQYSANILSFIDVICNGTVCVFVDYEIGKQIKDYVTNTRSAQLEFSFPKQIRIFFSGIITTKGNWQIPAGEGEPNAGYGREWSYVAQGHSFLVERAEYIVPRSSQGRCNFYYLLEAHMFGSFR